MSNEIPDGMDETPLHPQTVEGKIHEMRDIGVDLLGSTDRLVQVLSNYPSPSDHNIRVLPNAGLQALGAHIMKITTLCQLQTDTITQLYGELRGPESAW